METESTLSQLCSTGDVEMVKEYFASRSYLTQADLQLALEEVVHKQDPDMTRLLLSEGALLTRSAYLNIICSGKITSFQTLLDHGWNVNSLEFEDPPLTLVAGDEECVRWLLEHGADPNLKRCTGPNFRMRLSPLALAATQPNTAILELLLAHGASLDPEALFNAMKWRDDRCLQRLEYLLGKGIDVNTWTRDKGTPLHYAARVGSRECVQLLLDHGADHSIRSAAGRTAADVAKDRGYNDIYQLLSP